MSPGMVEAEARLRFEMSRDRSVSSTCPLIIPTLTMPVSVAKVPSAALTLSTHDLDEASHDQTVTDIPDLNIPKSSSSSEYVMKR